MSTVRPVEDDEKIQDIIDFLKARSKRNAFLLTFQLYTGMRISEMLPLKVRHVRNISSVTITESKTNKERDIPLGREIKKIINDYVEDMQDWEYLFCSKKGNKPITRQHAYRIYKDAAECLGIKRSGCHSPRKDFGAKLYAETGDIVLVQKVFGHSSASITERYIGLTKKKVEDAIMDISFSSRRKESRELRK